MKDVRPTSNVHPASYILHLTSYVLCLFLLLVGATFTYAQGLTIPSGSTVNVNSGTLNVEGDITNSGTLLTTTGTVTLSGNWTNTSGTYTPGTGLLNFTASSGTQTLDSSGTSSGKLFYNLTHSGAGTLQFINNTLNIDNDFTNSAGTVDANGQNMTVAGDWDNSATFTHGNNTVTLDGASQTVSGSTTFYTFSKIVTTAATLTFDHTGTQTFANSLTLQGASGQLLSIRSTLTDTAAAITLQTGGIQSLTFLDVKDSNAGGGLTLIARSSTNSLNNTNWVFGAATMTWDGSASTDWDTPANWDVGLVPNADDTAVIPNVATQPTLATAVTVENLTINSGATVTLNGQNLTVDTTFSNSGTVSMFGSETLSLTMDTDSGTFVLTGDGDGTAETFTIRDFGATDYYNLTINDTNATKDTFQTNGDLTVANDLTVTAGTMDISTNTNTLTVTNDLTVNGGTLTATNGNIDINADFAISSGTLTAPGAGQSFTIAGSFANSGGTFTHSSGTVTLDTTTTATISGSTTFHNLTSQVAGKQINFTAGTTQTVNSTLTFNGDATTDLILRSTVADSTWDITFPNGAQVANFVDVKDSDANTNIVSCINCEDSGNNNANWVFTTLTISIPTESKTVGQTPTVIGVGPASTTITLVDEDSTTVATTTSDANGNFRVAVSTALSTGANTLTPKVGVITGEVRSLTIVASPTTTQVPTITSPATGTRIHGTTITLVGKGAASETVSVVVNDLFGNQLLATVTTGATDAGGDYSFDLPQLTQGTNYISVTVDGTASSIIELILTDPFGVVFDSSSNELIKNAVVTIFKSDGTQAVVGTDLDPTDVNPLTTDTDGFYSFATRSGDYYITVVAPGYDYPSVKTSFPAGRTIVTGSKGETFTVVTTIIEMDHPVDPNTQLIRVEKSANKNKVKVGEVVTYTVKVESLATTNLAGVFLEDKIPPGFKYLEKRVTLDDVPTVDPDGPRPLAFNIGTMTPGLIKTFRYQLVVGSGVIEGNYDNTAFARYSDGTILSNHDSETVRVILDPLFDLGTVIGKVFWDKNQNGIQDPPKYIYLEGKMLTEDPVPNVSIMTEDGTQIRTDKNGMFHLPAIIPGRHLFRLDERSLPEGSFVISDKVVVVDVRPGLTSKVNFAVAGLEARETDKDYQYFTQNLDVIQNQGNPKPRLNVALFGNELRRQNGQVIKETQFRVFTNYAPFIKTWELDIIDSDTKKLIKRFSGDVRAIHDPIFWDGRDREEKPLREDRRYSYVLTVYGHGGQYDETEERAFAVREMSEDEIKQENEKTPEERLAQYHQWLKEEYQADNRSREAIPVDGETVTIKRRGSDLQQIRIIKGDQLFTEIAVVERRGLTAKELLEGRDSGDGVPLDIILPKGEYQIQVQAAGSSAVENIEADEPAEDVPVTESPAVEEESRVYQQYTKNLSVGDDYLTFVAMGDAEIGYTMTSGNIEPVEFNDRFRDGFWAEGKLAYYLRGKIKGKYLITSSFDTERERKELFRNLDEEEYYPVYGDAAEIDYTATDTQGNLYLLIEWDKSQIVWGNYNVGLTDTELAQFNRSLYGGKIQYESVAATKFGDPRTKLVVFRAKAQQKVAHNEFIGTGGSLFFLKHKDIVEGSEKVAIEVRDQISGLVVSRKEMKEGPDYDMDYSQGRILFWRPVTAVVESETIISSELLDGNPVYVVVDYEYEPEDDFDQATIGGRVQQAVTDYVITGATYVQDSQEATDYTLKGIDTTVRLGKDASLTVEFAETESEATGSFLSTDGGLSFNELPVDESARGQAYAISGDARLFNRLGMSAYYKWIDPGFSTPSTTAQQGKELIGVSVTYDINEQTRFMARQDIQSLIDDGNAQTKLQLGALRTVTTSMQIIHESRRLRLTGEYRRSEVTERLAEFDTPVNTEEDVIALRADYQLTDRVDVYVQREETLQDDEGDQTTIGAVVRPTDTVTIRAEETFGKEGSATKVGITKDLSENVSISGDYTLSKTKEGQTARTMDVGATAKIDEKTHVDATIGMRQEMSGATTTTVALGGGLKPDEDTEVKGSVGITDSTTGGRGTVLQFDAATQLDEQTTQDMALTVIETPDQGRSTLLGFGTSKKISEELELVSQRTFGFSEDETKRTDVYGLTRTKDGRTAEAKLTREFVQGPTSVSRANIFGLSGEINDRWAAFANLERGIVEDVSGVDTTRQTVSTGLSYVRKDEKTDEVVLKSSSKLEWRLDSSTQDTRQFLFFNAIEGKIDPNTTLFSKIEYARTFNVTTDTVTAEHKEIVLGGAYRPIDFDRLNLLARYTYLESDAPASQTDTAGVEEERTQVFATDAIYDINDRWQFTSKFAYRISDEKVTGFDFNRTHTWLMVQRLNYQLDKDWEIAGEHRMLTQREAQDVKRGFLIEASRNIGDHARIAAGYNFTDFSDDLTKLDYTAHGPYVRLTGKLYDRTPEEIARAKSLRLKEKVSRWAWDMVLREMDKEDSPVVQELNQLFYLAKKAQEQQELEKSQQIYKDIITAGQMMHEEAEAFVRQTITFEEQLQDYNAQALQYFKSGELLKAKELWQKVVEEAQSGMVEWSNYKKDAINP